MLDRQQQLQRANHVLTAMGVNTTVAKVMDRTHYITFDAKGKNSLVELLDSNTRRITGDTSFDANKFNKGRHFVIDSIRVLVEGTAEKVQEATWDGKAHKSVVNSEISLFQDEEILRLPVSDLLDKLNYQNQNQGFRPVSSAPVIVPEKEFNIIWDFPKSSTGVGESEKQLIRIELRGFEFFIK